MKLERVRNVSQKFPDGSTSSAVSLIFADGDDVVVKKVRISSCSKAVGAPLAAESTWQIMKAAREAIRDFAFKKHGEKWKDHIPVGDFWNERMSDVEKELVKHAVILMREAA
jgi:hypothetical protein